MVGSSAYSRMAPDSATVTPSSVTTGDVPSGWIARSTAGVARPRRGA